ncbi:MAG TPA: MotB family protein [Bosea sp. (in: a-proteobacteria)]|jgi:chemotaxis protein MotB|uniref:MotB family protein n=1 Tax=Bosea sp. (in: a-proteobacteria) TaxID=1871050 RepID=UPI002DDCB8FA|nr:MotB family protein [Bosea sp. (in: a-proteobacteria)]HEV2554409.1 MotB family protein [Bosea sp. (in: a-proteobacteria)]
MDTDRQDFIILRRSAGRPTDSIKTGVWKIAHADFMTAMMALFLVLWLVNSTNRETRTTVAQYFNPIKLSDTTSDRKGVRNPQDAEPGEVDSTSRHDGDQVGAAKTGSDRRPSATLKDPRQGKAAFEDPYAVLAEVAAAKPEPGSDRASTLTLGLTGKPGMNGGEAMRDPFDPNFWRQTPQTDRPERQQAFAGDAARAPPAASEPASKSQPPAEATTAAPASPAVTDTPPVMAVTVPATAPAMSPRPGLAVAASATAAASRADEAMASAIASAIAKGGPQRADQPQVDVKKTDEGVLISLTDNANFGMFGIGSAEPHPQTVAAMQRVAAVLKEREGAIVIRGHTDARPFRDGRSDNWRLSTSRAHTAQDLLVQGGINQSRIEHIEGHASRRPRAGDPNAAENRRIEILIREKRT